MNRWRGKIAVVTGASSGIGLAIARAFVREGMIVVGLARRKEKMEAGMKDADGLERFYGYECDVTNAQEVTDMFRTIKDKFGTVHVMINNAGVTTLGSISETSRDGWENVFGVNVMGLLDCAKHAIILMKEADVEGHIININSIQGHQVYKFGSIRTNVYAATKHAVTAITETLRYDLAGTKIRVTSVSPGLVKTEILLRNGIDVVSAGHAALEPEDIAESVLYVIGTPQRVLVTELTIRPMGGTR